MNNKPVKEVIFDLETQRWFDEVDNNDPGKLGVSIISAYTRELDSNFKEIKGEMKSFWEDELADLWPYFQEADRIIGFNSIGFDVPVLVPYANFPIEKLSHFDILAIVKQNLGHRLSLDAIAKETLQNQKIDNGAMAVTYWKRGDKESLAKLKKYCEADVALTRDVYDHGLHKKFLKYKDKWNTPRTFDVDFTYPAKEESDEEQIGLF